MELKLDYSQVRFQENGRLKLLIIVGTRPEIIRLAAVINKCRSYFDCLLRQALVKAAVACLHMEDGDMQTFRTYHAQAGVRVSQHQHGIRFHLHNQLVAGVDNIPHRGTEVIADGINIHIGVFQLQVTEEDTVQVIVVILAGVGQKTVKITAAD